MDVVGCAALAGRGEAQDRRTILFISSLLRISDRIVDPASERESPAVDSELAQDRRGIDPVGRKAVRALYSVRRVTRHLGAGSHEAEQAWLSATGERPRNGGTLLHRDTDRWSAPRDPAVVGEVDERLSAAGSPAFQLEVVATAEDGYDIPRGAGADAGTHLVFPAERDRPIRRIEKSNVDLDASPDGNRDLPVPVVPVHVSESLTGAASEDLGGNRQATLPHKHRQRGRAPDYPIVLEEFKKQAGFSSSGPDQTELSFTPDHRDGSNRLSGHDSDAKRAAPSDRDHRVARIEEPDLEGQILSFIELDATIPEIAVHGSESLLGTEPIDLRSDGLLQRRDRRALTCAQDRDGEQQGGKDPAKHVCDQVDSPESRLLVYGVRAALLA
jgi:hypothetical protein